MIWVIRMIDATGVEVLREEWVANLVEWQLKLLVRNRIRDWPGCRVDFFMERF